MSLLELKGLKSNDNVVVKKDVVDTEKQQAQQFNTTVKEGVSELFESNPELANEVYKALGFGQENNLSEKNIFTVEPIKSVDKKAKSKAKIATQYIGFAEGIAGSSTESYRQQILEQSTKKVSAKGKMTFSYGNSKRSDVNSNTTFEAIKNGERTATTRYESDGHIDYWKNLKVGDVIEWESATGEKIKVEVTKPLHKLVGSNKTAEQWSRLEGWSVDYFNSKVKPKLNEAWQIEYKPVQSSIVNSGNYSSNDVVFVSVSGKRGNEVVRKQQQDRTIREAIKALDAGATLITDNAAYVESNSYNEGEKRLAANLKDKGYNYSEIVVDGNLLGIWNKNTNQITPQQKQEAIYLYSQYLESLNKPNTNPILQGNKEEQVKKFAELQERLNNKEFVEGAKNAYESSKGLQEWGTQEQYNDYIARVSLGIVKNPSSGKYNYESRVKDIVYHGGSKTFEKFVIDSENRASGTSQVKKGIYLTRSKKVAKDYTQSREGITNGAL